MDIERERDMSCTYVNDLYLLWYAYYPHAPVHHKRIRARVLATFTIHCVIYGYAHQKSITATDQIQGILPKHYYFQNP